MAAEARLEEHAMMLRKNSAQMELLLGHNGFPVRNDIGHLRENRRADAPEKSGQHNDDLGDTESDFGEDHHYEALRNLGLKS